MSSESKLWTKDFIIVSAVNFLLTLVFYLLVVVMGVYAAEEFNATASQSGLVVGIFIVGALIGRLFIGRYIEKFGQKKTLFIGVIIFIVATSLYFFNFGIGFLLFNRFIHGIGLGFGSTATGTIVAQIIPAARKGEGIGYYSMSATLSTALGPFVGLYMSQHTSMQGIFGLCLAIGVISFFTVFFVKIPVIEETKAEKEIEKEEEKHFIAQFVEPRAVPIAIITLILALCYSSVLSFLNSYAIELDLVSAASVFFLVYSIAVLLSRPFTGRLIDLKGSNIVMYPAFVLFTIGMIVLGFAHSSFTLLLAGVLIGLGFGNMQSCTQAIAVKLTPPHRMGLATSTFFIFLDGGLGFGPYILGFIAPAIGFSTLYIVLGLVVLVTAGLYTILHGKKAASAQKQVLAYK
ncbi:MFS transporter [Oceanobacillus oncorhynchi subsp. incaldanensis]|uniref:MFS transporter n=1 Tax=Oceanobacillus oncorhynchi TaxID=545501 RepID=UPI001B17C71A|nr:MFS transporter [Oceanobacillus oncorhynchi]GIO21226.1 MFS transporter [Oceanobacillus oncorhynchi subsp. incaldanensis]